MAIPPPPPGFTIDSGPAPDAAPVSRPIIRKGVPVQAAIPPEKKELIKAQTRNTEARTDKILNPSAKPSDPMQAAKLEQMRGQQGTAKSLMAGSVGRLADAYLNLDRLGAAVSEKAGTERNIAARLRSSKVGQLLEGMTGTEAQRYRDRIAQTRPLLVQSIRQATGMSAKAMDSNRELQFYLDAASDPTRNFVENLAAIHALDKVYGSGGTILKKMLPPDLYGEVERSSGGFGREIPRGARAGDIEPGTVRVSRSTGTREQWDGSQWVKQ
jgi:hypothetical protein